MKLKKKNFLQPCLIDNCTQETDWAPYCLHEDCKGPSPTPIPPMPPAPPSSLTMTICLGVAGSLKIICLKKNLQRKRVNFSGLHFLVLLLFRKDWFIDGVVHHLFSKE